MAEAMRLDPVFACATLLAISLLAFVCCPTWLDIASTLWFTFAIISDTSFITTIADDAPSCMPFMRLAMSSALVALWFARSLISPATTANPFPASPALAASMVALRASKFVLSAIFFITSVTCPISLAAVPSLSIASVASLDLQVAS